MQTVYRQIYSKFLSSLTIQIFFVAILLVIAIFALNSYQLSVQKNYTKNIFVNSHKQLIEEKSALLYQKITLLGNMSLTLATQAEEILNYPNRYDNTMSLIKDGDFVRNNSDGKFTFYTNSTNDQQMRKVASQLALMLPILRSSIKNSMSISKQGFIKHDFPMSIVYPPLDSIDGLDSNYSPVEDDDFKLFLNNPRKQWRLIIPEKSSKPITIISPIFVSNNLVGVAGFELDSDLFARLLDGLDLPQNSRSYIVDSDQDRVLFGSKGNIYEDKNEIMIDSQVGETPIKVIITTSSEGLFSTVHELFEASFFASLILLGFVTLFYLIFYKLAKNEIRKLSTSITEPLNAIVRYTHNIGLHTTRRLEPTGVTELDELSNHLHLAHSKLTQMLIVDELTGTYNRRKLLIDLNDIGPFSLIVLNINRFKYLNDVYGYSAGDYVLKRVVELLKEIACDGCEIYRIGGDEFAMLLPITNQRLLEVHSENIRAAITNSLFLFNDAEMEISISVGVAIGSKKEGNKLLSKADVALSKAREAKQLPVMFYSKELEASRDYENNIFWEKRIKDAIRTGTMLPWFQPIMEAKSGKITRFEALVRIVEKGDAIPPYYFLDAARKTGAMYDIACVMIKKTFEVASKYPDIEFSINLAIGDFEHPNLISNIENEASNAGVSPEMITFEVLESEAMYQENSNMHSSISKLRKLGFKVAIDDFGSGYSNFARFTELEVDFLKIDGQFIRNIHRDETSMHAVKAILEFASNTNLKTVAEYVETRRAYEAVKLLPIDYLQGFYISKPVAEEDIASLIKR